MTSRSSPGGYGWWLIPPGGHCRAGGLIGGIVGVLTFRIVGNGRVITFIGGCGWLGVWLLLFGVAEPL